MNDRTRERRPVTWPDVAALAIVATFLLGLVMAIAWAVR